MTTKSKRCVRCKRIKIITKFYICKRLVSGRLGTCKECRKEGIRKYRQTEKGRLKYMESNKRYLNSKKGKAAIKRYYQSDKGKAAMKRANMNRKKNK